MKVYFANSSKQAIGGGWSFLSNIKKGLGSDKVTDDYNEADIYFIAGSTMVSRDEVVKAKDDGKKIVLRIDNVVRNSRNRNTGMSRMKDFARMADAVVYQSKWARDVLEPFTRVDGTVILNSVDEHIFRVTELERPNTYLYSRFNRDETKNWEVARHTYQEIQKDEPDAKLYIVGQFSVELIEGNFDFFMGEHYEYLGIVNNPNRMSEIYNQTSNLIFTYYNDACSNTLIEALMCGCNIVGDDYYINSGGSKEIMGAWDILSWEQFALGRMTAQYERLFHEFL